MIKKVFKNIMRVGLEFKPSWDDFWQILAPRWGSSWAQVGAKIKKNWGTKTMSKKRQKSGGAVPRSGRRPSWVRAPKNPPGIPILEYKCPMGRSIRDTPLSGRWPGVGCGFHLILCGFHMIPYGYHLILLGIHMILYGFQLILYAFHISCNMDVNPRLRQQPAKALGAVSDDCGADHSSCTKIYQKSLKNHPKRLQKSTKSS